VTVYCDKAVTSTVTNCVPRKVRTIYPVGENPPLQNRTLHPVWLVTTVKKPGDEIPDGEIVWVKKIEKLLYPLMHSNFRQVSYLSLSMGYSDL